MRMAQLRGWAQAIKKDVVALYIAGRDPRVPWYAKLAAVVETAFGYGMLIAMLVFAALVSTLHLWVSG